MKMVSENPLDLRLGGCPHLCSKAQPVLVSLERETRVITHVNSGEATLLSLPADGVLLIDVQRIHRDILILAVRPDDLEGFNRCRLSQTECHGQFDL